MLYRIPDYYKKFKCTADQCEDTCCAGWQIFIDDKSLKKYRSVCGQFRPRMLRSVDWKQGDFKQDQEKRCAFLNEKSLCDLYIHMGSDYLCNTCKMFPRHVEEYENMRELSLSISCPEAARMIMNLKEPVHFLRAENSKKECYEVFDHDLFESLLEERNNIIKILQNRKILFRERVEKLLQYKVSFRKEVILGSKLFREAMRFERIREDWETVLYESKDILYKPGIKVHEEIRKAYDEWKKMHPETEIYKEQILIYFIYTYFLGAVYDGRRDAKVWMSVCMIWLIDQLWMARWQMNGGNLSLDEMIELVYRFSREVEHSDNNLERLEDFLIKYV